MTKALEPMDKLDAGASSADGAGVNGPEGVVLDWDAVDWRAAEDQVRRLGQRIFAATAAGDCKKVRSLQRLMLRSLSNALVSVRQVTERNAGRLTPGVDGRVVLSAAGKEGLVAEVAWSPRQARPVRRVFIPKANGKLRPLGIPTEPTNLCRSNTRLSGWPALSAADYFKG
jgi:RNA-directed DNA polymerase